MIDEAARTLRRGTGFLRRLSDHPVMTQPWPDDRRGVVRAHYVGNCLAEVDRFLHVLMDEAAPLSGLPATPDQRNTPNKIGRLLASRWDATPDQLRLKALGRSRFCLCRCDGVVRRADFAGGDWMTSGWRQRRSLVLRRYDLGEALQPSGQDLADVGHFYDELADRIVAAVVPA